MNKKGAFTIVRDLFKTKKGVTPLMATLFLILLSVSLGAIVMVLGEAYIGEHANFARGIPEVGSGCDLVNFKITRISGVAHVCVKDNTIDVSLDNEGSIVIDDFHARIHGSDGVSNVQNLLVRSLNLAEGVRLRIPYLSIGKPLKIVLTPRMRSGMNYLYCSEKSVAIENLPNCE